MAVKSGKGKGAVMPIPDWVRAEKDEKRKDAILSYLLSWSIFGFDNPSKESLDDYFNIGTDGWTQEDTRYIIDKFVEHGVIKI